MYDQHVVVAWKLRPIITIKLKVVFDRIVKTERQSKSIATSYENTCHNWASCVEGRLLAVLLPAALIQASNK
jgi:hypothetical protein